MSENTTSAIATWSATAGLTDLPASARELAARALLDTLAVALLGSRLEGPRIAARLELARGARAEASLIGLGQRCDLLAAGLINGTAAHADLFDDNSAPMIAHPSAPLYSALLPLAQVRGKSGRDLIDAYVVGFEVGVRLGRRLNPTLYEHGWHATRVLGVLGTTAACCRLAGLDAQRTAAAIGIAVSMASGVRQAFGTMTMALHVGLTARDALHCMLLAEGGFEADANAINGKYGFAALFAGRQPEPLALGAPWELVESGIIFKPYPSGAPSHAAIDAALALRARLGGAAAAIARVECLVHPWNAMTLREEEPRDMLQAKVNLRFCVAAALLYGVLGFKQFSAATLADPALRAMMARITIAIGDDLPDNGEFPAAVRVMTHSGELLTERREVPPGGSTRPFGWDGIEAKFRDCAQLTLDDTQADVIIAAVKDIDAIDAIDSLCTLLEGKQVSL